MKGIHITATVFDFMRWRLEGFYRGAEQAYAQEGINISIQEADAIPLNIDGEYVEILVTATEYQFLDTASRDLVYGDTEE
jgi:diacylglycerol kinase family enzyme